LEGFGAFIGLLFVRMYALLFLALVATVFGQSCTTTDPLNVRSCAGTGCAVLETLPPQSTVTIVSQEAPFANGHSWAKIGEGRWVARTYLQCQNNPINAPVNPPSGGSDVSSFPTTFSANGYTYNGYSAQVLHFLQRRFSLTVSTYASHSEGATASADLWTPGATFGNNNGGIASMNSLADYAAANLGKLRLKYVIWKQRINLGNGWTPMSDRGSITQNHFDHVHITFQAGARAVADQTSTFQQQSTASGIPSWGMALIAINVILIVSVVVLVVLIVISRRRQQQERV